VAGSKKLPELSSLGAETVLQFRLSHLLFIESSKTRQVKFLQPSFAIKRGVSGSDCNLVAIIDEYTGLTIANSCRWITGNGFSALLVFICRSGGCF
jgi:hypothetical protein